MIAWLLAAVALAAPPTRDLAGHQFVLPIAVETPFVSPWIALRQGGGLLHLPGVTVDGLDKPVDATLGGLVEGASGQVALHERVGVWLLAEGQVTTGVNGPSAYAFGGRAAGTFALGGRYVAWTATHHLLSLTAGLQHRAGVVVAPHGIVDALLDDRERTLREIGRGDVLQHLLWRERHTAGRLGVCHAWAISQRVGLQSSVAMRVGPSTTSHDELVRRSTRVAWGGGVALDWTPSSAPIAAQIELLSRWDFDAWIDGGSDTSGRGQAVIGLVYSGDPRVQVGVAGTALVPTRRALERLYTAEIRLRYLFGVER